MTIDEAIAFCHEKSNNIKLKAEPQVFIQLAEWLEELKAIKDNCDGKCTNCSNTELPNIKDCKDIDIGYSYAYKTDCAGDRYIKAEEVKFLIKCERGKAIDDFVNVCEKQFTTMYGQRYVDMRDIKIIAEQLREQK